MSARGESCGEWCRVLRDCTRLERAEFAPTCPIAARWSGWQQEAFHDRLAVCHLGACRQRRVTVRLGFGAAARSDDFYPGEAGKRSSSSAQVTMRAAGT